MILRENSQLRKKKDRCVHLEPLCYHELVVVLFLRRYGFDISLYQTPYKVGRLFVDTQISAVAPIRERRFIDHLQNLAIVTQVTSEKCHLQLYVICCNTSPLQGTCRHFEL